MPQSIPLAGGVNDLTGEVKDGVLFLSFTVPQKNRDGSELKDLAGFKIFRTCGTCAGSFEPYRDIVLEENKGYTVANGRLYFYDDDLKNGQQYGYKVYPFTQKGSRGDASNIFTVQWQKPPQPPQEVNARPDDGRIDLTWSTKVGTLYNVYRHDNNMYPLFPLNPERLKTGSFTDGNLANNTKYTYEIRAVTDSGGMAREGEGIRVEAIPVDKTPPPAPVAVKATKQSGFVLVTWEEVAAKDLAGYNIYRIKGSSTVRVNSGLVRNKPYEDRKTTEDRFVSYYVTSVDTAGNESEPSQESIIILKAVMQ